MGTYEKDMPVITNCAYCGKKYDKTAAIESQPFGTNRFCPDCYKMMMSDLGVSDGHNIVIAKTLDDVPENATVSLKIITYKGDSHEFTGKTVIGAVDEMVNDRGRSQTAATFAGEITTQGILRMMTAMIKSLSTYLDQADFMIVKQVLDYALDAEIIKARLPEPGEMLRKIIEQIKGMPGGHEHEDRL